MEYLRGYQIYCIAPCTLKIIGSSPASTHSLNVPVGDNLVGVDITNNAKSASAAFFDIAYSSIKWYNPDTQALEEVSDSDTVYMGRCYWIECTSTSTYEVSALKNITTFTYDGDGGRVTKTVNGASTVYIGSLFEKKGYAATRHIFLGDTRIASVGTVSGALFYHSDHLGSTSDVTDKDGDVLQHTEYQPYGETYEPSSWGNETDYLYTSKLLDKSTSLYYYGARYYDPELGRFTQADTIVPDPSDPQAFNRYGYANNNPINYTDPTGHSFWDKAKSWIGHAVGAVAGVVAWASTGFTNPLGGFQVYSFVSGAINSAISGDVGAFAAGTAASFALGGFCQGIGESVAKATIGISDKFVRGALIGAAEFGAAGFIAGTASEYARTGSFSDALRGGAWGATGGAVFGAAIEGSYVAGWQNTAHGLSLDHIDAIDMTASFDRLDASAKQAWVEAHMKEVMFEARLKTDVGKDIFKSYAGMMHANNLIPINPGNGNYYNRYFEAALNWTFKRDFIYTAKMEIWDRARTTVASSSIFGNAVRESFLNAYSTSKFITGKKYAIKN